MLKATAGTAPVNWNNRDVPEYRPWTPYDEMLDEMAMAGYPGTEIGTEFPEDPARVLADLGKRGLLPASTFCSLNLRNAAIRGEEIERAVGVARFLKKLGVDIILIADGGDVLRRAVAGHAQEDAGLAAEQWQSVATGLDDLGQRCNQLGVRVAFHNHVGTYIETEGELSRLLTSTDAECVGLCFDVGHMVYAGGDVERIMRDYGGRLRYVHLKDVDPEVLARCRREGLGFHDALRLGIFPEFGKGIVNFDAFFSALDARNYAGWIIAEQDTTAQTPLASAIHNRAFLRDRFDI